MSGLAAPVDLLGILQTALTGDQALNEAPPLVIVALANIYVEGDAEYWVDACIKWSADYLELAPCITIPRDGDGASRLPLRRSMQCEDMCTMSTGTGRRCMACAADTMWPSRAGAECGFGPTMHV